MKFKYLRKTRIVLFLFLVVCIGMASEPVATIVTIIGDFDSEKSDIKEEKVEKKTVQRITRSRMVREIQFRSDFPKLAVTDYISSVIHFKPEIQFKGNRNYKIPILRAPPSIA